MDPQHRHDLEENDLQTFLVNFKEWWARYGNYILIGVLVIAVALFAKRMIDKRTAESHEEAWSSLSSATSPEICQKLALSYDKPGYQAAAYLKAGDLWLQQALIPAGGTANTEQSPEARRKNLEEAQTNFKRVTSLNGADVVFSLNAQMGLAAVAEAQGDWDAAAKLYGNVQESAGDKYAVIAAQAANRAAMLDSLKRPVAFAPEPPEPPAPVEGPLAPSTQPTTQPDTQPLALPLPIPETPAPIAPASATQPALP